MNPLSLFAEDTSEDDTDDKSIVTKRWEETGLVLKIMKFDETKMSDIFGKSKSFAGNQSYKMFVIMKCIPDYTTVMMAVDSLGITADIPPQQLAEMLYKFCIEVNPFLDLDKVDKSIVKIGSGPKNATKKQGPTRRTEKTTTTSAKTSTTTKTEKCTFSTVPSSDLLVLGDKIKKFVIGQDSVIDTVVDAIQIAGAGLRDPGKPIGSFIFTGDSGVGKTWMAKVLSKELCGQDRNIVRIDCSEYSQSHEVAKLIGSPAGYVGYDAGGYLTNQIIENPFSIILFDELEKAHSRLYDILLQILDEGRLTDNKGTTVDFCDCVVIMTSNIGAKDVKAISSRVGFGDVSVITSGRRGEAIDKALRKHFRPEFLNRIDAIITFNQLGKEECYKIIDLAFDEISSYLTAKKIKLFTTLELRDEVLKRGFSKEYGARPLRRTIERDILMPLARKILKGEIKENTDVVVDMENGTIVFDPRKKKSTVVKKPSVSKNIDKGA
jgi:ATP-dependent Clp protease ATP-binding subunit ClpA